MNSFFRYPGGKGKLSKVILGNLTKFNDVQEYREPFFGGGSIGLNFLSNTYNVKNVWINDKDNGIASIWQSIVYNVDELKDRINQFKPAVDKFYSFKEELLSSNEISVDIGFKKLALHQISYSGLGTKSGSPLGGKNQTSDYKIDCRWSPDSIIKKIDSIHKCLSNFNVKITSGDFSNMLIDNESNNTVVYLDPPYYQKGNELYQFAFTEEDHKRLAECLQKTRYNWVLSYDDCKEIRKLYSWANIQVVNVNYSITTSRTKPELIISKG